LLLVEGFTPGVRGRALDTGDVVIRCRATCRWRKARRGVHRKRRERRPLPGMMLHIDGSEHHWFQNERKHDLIVILDNATSDIYYAQLAPDESTFTVMAALRALIEQKGLFCSPKPVLRLR
jgi:hypothetical protein